LRRKSKSWRESQRRKLEEDEEHAKRIKERDLKRKIASELERKIAEKHVHKKYEQKSYEEYLEKRRRELEERRQSMQKPVHIDYESINRDRKAAEENWKKVPEYIRTMHIPNHRR